MKRLTQKEVIAKMKREQGQRPAKEYAAQLGISAQYLSDIYLGKREPGPSVLESLGLERTIMYVNSETRADVAI